MYGFIWFTFDRVRINFPREIGSHEDGNLGYGDGWGTAYHWLREAKHPLRLVRQSGASLFDAERLYIRRQSVTITSAEFKLRSDGSFAVPDLVPMEYRELASMVEISLYVNVMAGEGYPRGIHKPDWMKGHVTVVYKPTEKTLQSRFLIEGKETDGKFDLLSKLYGKILAGRKPEILHTHKAT